MPGLLDHGPSLLRRPRDGDGDGSVMDATTPRPVAAATHPVPPPRPDLPPPSRDFGDSTAIRGRIYDNVLKAAQSWKPIENQRHTLSLENVEYDDPAEHDIAGQKAAILRGDTIGRRLRGDWVLRDNATGGEVDRKRSTLASVPYITPRGTFIQGGNEYTLAHQLRLRPGVYARVKDNGELEAHGNVVGMGHRIFLEPDTGVFRLTVGQAKMPLVPLLKAMGMSDSALMRRWGNELGSANLLKDDPSVIDKLHAKLVRVDSLDGKTRAQQVADAFEAMALDPDVMRRTLGKPYDRVSAESLLAVADKLVAINKGQADPDDRDHLAYMSLHGPEDLIAERIGRDKAGLRKVLWRASMAGSLKSVPTNLFTKSIQSAITSSGLGQPSESINPAMIFEQQGRVSRMGDGGIPCYSADTEVLTFAGWKFWPDALEDDLFACQRSDGSLYFQPAESLHSAEYSGEMLRGVTDRVDYLVTPSHRMYVASATTVAGKAGYGNWRFRDAAEVHGKHVRHKLAAAEYDGGSSPTLYAIPPAPIEGENCGSARQDSLVVDFADWVAFMACYLAEGSFSYSTARSEYRIEIGKRRSKNPVEYEFIKALLDRLGFTYRYEQDRRFVVNGKHLVHYVSKFGHAIDKFAPQYVLTADAVTRRLFFETLTTMDNSGRYPARRVYASASKQLAEQVGFLAITLGYSVTYKTRIKSGENPQYQVIIRDAAEAVVLLQKKRDQYQKVPYAGKVYCASVPGTLLLVRRNGKTFWCGNSLDSVPAESRNVQPSHLAFIDPLVTPESLRVGVDSRISRVARKGDDGRIYAPFTDVRTGGKVWKSPQDVADAVVAFPGEMQTQKPYVAAMVGGRTQYVRRNRVQYQLPHMEDAFSPMTNLVPMKSAVKGQRAVMAGRMITQALPVEDAESPLVQSGVPGSDGDSYEQLYGEHMGALRTQHGGTVLSVSPDKVVLRGPDGATVEHQLYSNFPYNRKTYIHQTPVVQPGQQVPPGELLARSNYTDDKGVTALGKNARVAYVPFRGLNFEDAIVVSEAFAKRMKSQHMYQHSLDLDEGVAPGKKAHTSVFAAKYDRKTLENFDDDGVVKPGTVVSHDHPLILAIKKKDVGHNSIHRGRTATYDDHTVTWDHHTDGVVTDVAKTAKGIVVAVKTHANMEVGDKLCYDPSTWMLTRKGWKLVADINLDDEIATLNPTTDKLEYQRPTHVHRFLHDGPMYYLNTKHVNMLVTPNHQLWVARPYQGYGPVRADEFYASKGEWQFKKDCGWDGVNYTEFTLDLIGDVQADAWLEFLGYYLAEGWCAYNNANTQRTVKIAQFRSSDAWQKIHDNLTALGLSFRYNEGDQRFEIPGGNLYAYLQPLGDSYTKRVPDYVQECNQRQLRIFLDAYLAGDGHTPEARTWEYGSSSEGLAADMQVICLKLGWAVTIRRQDRKDNWQKQPHWRGRINKHHLRPWWKKSRAKTYQSNEEAMVTYTGEVYCVTVPNHVVYIKRDDKTHWSMNSGRYGDKGIVSAIIPDHEMPHSTVDGKSYEVLLNPLGIISRTNPAQMHEAALGKIAAITGQPYRVQDFQGHDLNQMAINELARHGMADREDLIDPVRGSKIKDVFTGNRFFMKLHHTAESKGQGRGTAGYTMEGRPARGGPEGSKRISLMDVNAILSHGATEVLRDAGAIRGQQHPELWQQFMSGHKMPNPKVPFVHQKFVDMLKASGINVVREGTRTNVMAMTDKDVDELSGDRELEHAETVDWKAGLKPIAGGLFDPHLTGGHNGNLWSHVKLEEPMPNPAMEEPIRRMLGLTEAKFRDVLSGRAELNGRHGPTAIANALGRIKISDAMQQARQEIRSGRKGTRDMAVRKLGFLRGAEKTGVHPRDWMMTKVPVLPPMFRPVSVMSGSKLPLVADPNYLYKELHDANRNLAEMRPLVGDLSEERLALYDSFKGVVGLGDPLQPKNQERQVKGLLRHVFGTGGPKTGMVQRKLLGSATDLVGRAVITPNPDLDMDQVGIPEARAWDVYKPFIVRRLVRRGMQNLAAAKHVSGRTDVARQAMVEEMGERPVILTRAPVLHRYGTMGFRPVLTKGDVLQVSPLCVTGFGADFDGDAMSYHVPASDEAVNDVYEKMLPSRNLLAVSNYRVHQLPSKEYGGGLYSATTAVNRKAPPRVYRTMDDVLKAYRNGEINVDHPVHVMEA